MTSLSGQCIEAIKVANVPAGMRGMIEHNDNAGRIYVLWENGTQSVIQERGETYRLIEFKNLPKRIFWNLKKLFVILFTI